MDNLPFQPERGVCRNMKIPVWLATILVSGFLSAVGAEQTWLLLNALDTKKKIYIIKKIFYKKQKKPNTPAINFFGGGRASG
jgi:hypothetical protein